MWKRSFGARPPSKSESGRCENEAFVRDFSQLLKVVVLKMTPALSVPQRVRSENDLRTPGTVSNPSAGQASPSILQDKFCPAKHRISCIRYLNAFRARLPSKVKAEDVKTKLWCEASLKKWRWKMWKQSFGARPPSKSGRGGCENEALVRDLPQKVKVEDVKTKLSCETSLSFWKLKWWKWRLTCQFHSASDQRMIRGHPELSRTRPPVKLPHPSSRTRVALQNTEFHASAISTHCVRDFLQKVRVEDVKTKLWCEASLKKWRWKMWKRSFGARPSSKSESGRCENEALVRDLPQKVEDVKTKLSCETALSFWKLNRWKWRLNCQFHSASDQRMIRGHPGLSRTRPPDKLPHPSSRTRVALQNTVFRASAISTHCVRDFPQKVKVEDVKTKLLCETSLSFWKLKFWKWRRHCPFHSASDQRMIRGHPGLSGTRPPDKLPHLPGHVLPCKTQNYFVHPLSQRIACETSLRFRQSKMWERSNTKRSWETLQNWK